MGNDQLTRHAVNIRRHILKMMLESKSSHIGSCFSIVEILTLLYFEVLKIEPENPLERGRDRFILSKGHGSAALYATLAEAGLIPEEQLRGYYQDGGKLPGHLDRFSIPFVESSAGSLGHGLSIGLGMALASQRNAVSGKVVVLLGDGECNEGSVWEAVMLASHLKLSNLHVIVDCNRIQSFGMTGEVINLDPLGAKWKAFGWEVDEGDGHDFDEIRFFLEKAASVPRVLIANTIKGKGVSFMENSLEWHYRSPSDEQYEKALAELDGSSN
ncbi:MAG: transketolase [Pseudomonadota bacterium]|nr:transketolase [Pseudomonadota bacterium]